MVDTNILSYFYLHSEFTDLTEQLYKKDPIWTAPLLWRSEFRNVLSVYVRKNLISLIDAIEIFEAAQLLLEKNEFEINSLQVLKLAHQSGCSAYDCEFVNLAQDLNINLVTMDKKILNNFQNTAKSLQEFINTK